MDIAHVVELKRKLESDIKELVFSFEVSTGLCVEGVYFAHADVMCLGEVGQTARRTTNVSLEVQL